MPAVFETHRLPDATSASGAGVEPLVVDVPRSRFFENRSEVVGQSCRACGHVDTQNALFCRMCGKKLASNKSAQQDIRQQKRTPNQLEDFERVELQQIQERL
jgi:predicted amidophosphoribosyltransferase